MAAPLIAIVGSTASGKSRLALDLALAHGGEIVSCDSLQVYRGLDIGSAKPGLEERRRVPHHLIDVADPTEDFSAAAYARLARAAVRDISARGRLPLVVGGTGLYLRSLLQGLFVGPSRDEGLRQRLTAWSARFGPARVHRLLHHVDPEAAARIEVNDVVRVVRALEVFWLTGRPISRQQVGPADPLTGFSTLMVGLRPDRETLRAAVAERTRRMFDEGLVEEVERLLASGVPSEVRPLQSIGYRQALAVIRATMSRADAERETVTATMQYAKRQMTWFRHQADVLWCRTVGEASLAVRSFLSP